MYISSLSLKNFRNYHDNFVEFSPHTNLIYGNNAQGKTNILEAVYLFAQGRSHRTRTDKELIRFGCDFAEITINFHDSARDYNACMRFLKNGKKSVKINNVPIKKLSQLMSYLNVVMFSPEDLNLVKGSPSCRRHFCDSAISQLHSKYLSELINYNKVLAQKNTLLKTLHQSRATTDTTLSVWNEQLAAHGAQIMQYRTDFINSLRDFVCKIQKQISGEELEISYRSGIKLEEITKDSFFEYVESRQTREIDFGSACYGVQRDDIDLIINGKDAKIYGSQGQQRTVTLSLKIALADYFHSKRDEYPVLLLDDIMSELDINRRLYLAKKIQNKQVLITSTDTDIVENTPDTKLFKVDNGNIIY